ncbi:hypothetical protein BKA69DRAFT_1174066 [Paraphysoderma sedebokerense]|nr:hypothetical protein BKA69DRAFT_1174066 [Paraphysoderma sedebokerense]
MSAPLDSVKIYVETPNIPPPAYSEHISKSDCNVYQDPRYLPAPVFMPAVMHSISGGRTEEYRSFPLLFYPGGLTMPLSMVKTEGTQLLPSNFTTIARSKLNGISNSGLAKLSRQQIKITALLFLGSGALFAFSSQNALGGPRVVSCIILGFLVIMNITIWYLMRKRINDCCNLLSEQSEQLVGKKIKLEYIPKKLWKKHTTVDLGEGQGTIVVDENSKEINLERVHVIKVSFYVST